MAKDQSQALDLAARKIAMPTDEDELIAWAEYKRDLGKSVTSEMQMKLNLAFMLGYQWVTFNTRTRTYDRVVPDPTDPNAPVMLTANKIASIAERSIAKLTKDAPIPECRPVSDNDNDVATAKVGTRVLDSEMTRLDWKTWLTRFLFWPTTLGHSYVHIYWDPDDGDAVATDTDTDEALFMGNIKFDIVPAFELSVDPSAKDNLRQAKWAVRRTVTTREGAFERFGVELDGGAQRSLAHDVIALSGTVDPGALTDEWVEINQLWMVPCRVAPKGLVLTWSSKKVLERKDFPFDHGVLPFEQNDQLPGIGTREGRTWVTDLVPIQTDYNDALSREATIRRTLIPKLLAAAGSVDPQRINARLETIVYNPVAEKPELLLPNAGWAQQFEIGMNRDAADMGDRAGISDASAGQSASSAPAAAILALQEADDTKLAITATELASFVKRVGWQVLMLARQYWDEKRTVRTWSDDDIIEAYRYLGSDIDEQLDVHVSAESALPKSKAARTQLVMELQARMPDLMDPQTMMRMLDLPNTDQLTRTLDEDTRRAVRENGKLASGEDVKVMPFDNHVIHLKVINSFRKSSDYENLPLEDRARYDAHAAVHESLVLKQLGMTSPWVTGPQGMQDPAAAAEAERVDAGPAGPMSAGPGAGSTPMYVNPATGVPNNPLAVASGQAPSPLAGSAVEKRAGIGQGAGQPGRVPGVSPDQQAHSMGN